MSVKEVHLFAQLCDKYDCLFVGRSLLGKSVHIELQSLAEDPPKPLAAFIARAQLLAAAYLVGNKKATHRAAVELVANSTYPITAPQTENLLSGATCGENLHLCSLDTDDANVSAGSRSRKSPPQDPADDLKLRE
jgi:hypothetical protein